MRKPNTVIVDTREPEAFVPPHILSSLKIWLEGVSFFPGWTLAYEQRILLVTERKEDVETAKAYLWRLGFDNILGFLCPRPRERRDSGKPTDHLRSLSAAALKEKLDRDQISFADVRDQRE